MVPGDGTKGLLEPTTDQRGPKNVCVCVRLCVCVSEAEMKQKARFVCVFLNEHVFKCMCASVCFHFHPHCSVFWG